MEKCSGIMTFIFNTPIKFNTSQLSFRSNQSVQTPQFIPFSDGFSSNPLNETLRTKALIEAEVKTNPKIQEILKEYKIPAKINMAELEKLQKGHLKDCRIVSAQIYSALPSELKQGINLPHLQEAAMFHDYGKVLIPEKILNKAGKLNENEQEIMHLHSELGYELLKNKGLSNETLNLIKYHHQTRAGDGYPQIENGFEYNLSSEILSVADKYTALREQRSYKNAMTHQEALEVIRADVGAGLVSEEVFRALEKGVY